MNVTHILPIDFLLDAIGLWVVLGVVGAIAGKSTSWIQRLVFPSSALTSLLLLVISLLALSQPVDTLVLPLGLPGLPFHLRLDDLSAFFLLLLGAASLGVSLYSAGYFRAMENATRRLFCLEYHLFLASMALVMLADDAYLFLVAWESMALSSYFLVTTDHKIPDIRRAGFIYLLIAHLGALALLLCFGILQGGHGDYAFAALRNAHLSSFWATTAFLLALFGFGAKAGLLPLHVWLPEAHPAAPSPVSALMSGVMLKTAIYGLLRITFDLLRGQQPWEWGALALGLGLLTALFGVAYAAVQSDMKRLLAYSSIENIGILLVGIGLTLLFHTYRLNLLAALSLAATLYHSLNHAFFKSLLFLGVGSVLHATGERNLGKLGGLIHRMPWVAWTVLIGTLAIAGLPPLNGFISEWLLLQAFLFSPRLPHPYLVMMMPVASAALVLAVALAAYVMVKFYGIVFLGQPRETKLAQARDAGIWERLGLGWLAAGCLFLGLAPALVIPILDYVTRFLVGDALGSMATHNWLFLTPVLPERASYSPLFFLGVIASVVALTFFAVRRMYHGRLRYSDPWDCGYPETIQPRMQDTAEGFSQPILRIFEPFFHIEREQPDASTPRPRYREKIEDRLWRLLYRPLIRFTDRLSGGITRLQHGRIHLYLLYSFLTLLALLIFVR
ncbi:MAG TPA: hydrogenase 4 subunit B [Betaproteobacteria bacterium]|nr:hydrogenase 4 subunit B [Betaproteobacteria bacterium]